MKLVKYLNLIKAYKMALYQDVRVALPCSDDSIQTVIALLNADGRDVTSNG